MYIALKWLISLALGMWLAMCFTDLVIKQTKRTVLKQGLSNPPVTTRFSNLSRTDHKKVQFANTKQQSTEVLHLVMFIAGGLAVSVFNKKTYIFKYFKFDGNQLYKMQKKIENTAATLGVAIINQSVSLWEKTKNAYQTYKDFLDHLRYLKHSQVIIDLLDKMKQLREERNNINQHLNAAIHENKNIGIRYQLEVLAKNRLLQHIENTQKQMKQHRSRYVSFQQLYLVTHQENIFLKSRIRKLTLEKDDVVKNLTRLITEIYKSNSTELKAYCSNIIMNAKDNKINTDVSAVVGKFLEKSLKSMGTYANSENIFIGRKVRSPDMYDVIQSSSIVPTKSDLPKLKGLPGEYVWTVKDKNGIIEKLYEYDSESEYDNGETIRRIRQYSVYFDRDCLLDFNKSSPDSERKPLTYGYSNNNTYPVTSKRIVTGSEAFQNFLRNNKSVVPTKQTRMVLQK